MANPHSRNHSAPQDDTEALNAAEQRAAEAEHRVEELEQRIEALESAPRTISTRSLRSTSVERDSESLLDFSTESGSKFRSESNLEAADGDALAALRQEPMMDHLLNALDAGQDIGHYGRLVFAMVAHHFLPEDAMLEWLTKDRDVSPEQAETLLRQVESRDYNPPRRDRILEWQSQQEFPILPNPDDPDCGNVYRNLKFPQSVYEHIQGYQEEKVHAENPAPTTNAAR